MAKRNVFSKFGGRTTFVNAGFLVVSVLFAVQYALGKRSVLDTAWLNPVAAHSLAAAIAAFGVVTAKSSSSTYSPWRDGLPLLAFSVSILASGVQKNWAWLLFALAITANVVFLLYGRSHGDYDEDDDRIVLPFRWPF